MRGEKLPSSPGLQNSQKRKQSLCLSASVRGWKVATAPSPSDKEIFNTKGTKGRKESELKRFYFPCGGGWRRRGAAEVGVRPGLDAERAAAACRDARDLFRDLLRVVAALPVEREEVVRLLARKDVVESAHGYSNSSAWASPRSKVQRAVVPSHSTLTGAPSMVLTDS